MASGEGVPMSAFCHPRDVLELADKCIDEAITELEALSAGEGCDGAPAKWREARELIASALLHPCLERIG